MLSITSREFLNIHEALVYGEHENPISKFDPIYEILADDLRKLTTSVDFKAHKCLVFWL